MLIINMPKEYDRYFKEVIAIDSNAVRINYSKNFSGGSKMAEVVITLAPIIVPAVIATLKEILKHIQEMKRIKETNPDEITVIVKKSDIEVAVAVKSSDITTTTDVDQLVENIIAKGLKKK